jgi:predicted transcriptional regulator
MVKYTSVTGKQWNRGLESVGEDNRIGGIFDALGHSSRRSIVNFIAYNTDVSISDIAEHMQVSLPAAQKQVGILEVHGLIVCKKKSRTVYCSLKPKAFDHMINWLLSRQQFWTGSFDRLEKHLSINKKTQHE